MVNKLGYIIHFKLIVIGQSMTKAEKNIIQVELKKIF